MLKNMKIGKRLIAAFVIVALIVSTSGVFGVFLFIKTESDYDHALENYGFASGKIGMLSSEINRNRAYVRDIAFLTDREKMDIAYKKIQEGVARIDVLMAEVHDTNTSDAAKELFATIEKNKADYRVVRDQVIEYGFANEQAKAYELWSTQASPMVSKVCDDIKILYQMNFDAGKKVSDDLAVFGRNMLIAMVLCIIAGYTIAVVFATFISRGIARPLVEIEQGAKKMAVGDYDVQIDYHSQDEVGSLASSMRSMMTTTKAIIVDTSRALNEVANGNFDIEPQSEFLGVFKGVETAITQIISGLSNTMSQIKEAADSVSTGSEQVSAGAQALAQGATEQASAVQELSASINEISEHIRGNASNAQEASNLVVKVSGNIQDSNVQMTEMMSAMNQISDSSSQISKIIKTIEDIAFQTNILALNAAVEAARAGVAGKGFAVVADEVRSLATKSSEAAKQTNVLIDGSVARVENGVKIATETARSLAEVVEGAQEVTTLITKISQVSSDQANSICQINRGVEQISSVVQTNSATSEQSAAASETLNGQANRMRRMMARFKLKQTAAKFIFK